MNISFRNKTVLITGASRGIGAQLAQDFSRLGARLILTATQPQAVKKLQALASKKKYKAQCLQLDFRDEISTKDFLGLIAKEKVDVCINNAGINEIDFIEDTRVEAWDEIMNVNLKGPFLLTRALAKGMKKRRYGRIINVASILGVVTRKKRSIYCASKAGLLGLTRTAAIELAGHNILVNAVSPGFVWTDLTRRILSKKEAASLTAQIPCGRMAAAKDISSTVLFLASDHNTYIAGQNIIVDGGYVIV